jgi:hypothetical protein
MSWTTSRSRNAYWNTAVKSPNTSSANVPTASMWLAMRENSAAIVRMTWAYSGTSMSASASAARA